MSKRKEMSSPSKMDDTASLVSETKSSVSKPIKYTLIQKNLSLDVLQRYLDKFRVFKFFYPTILSCMGNMSIEYEPGQYQDYDPKTDRGKYKENEKRYIASHLPTSLSNAYMWEFKSKPEVEWDQLDRNFMEYPDQWTKHEFYGLHTYGGYYGFLRPDLEEVINLIHETIPIENLNQIRRIYVTSEAHPDDNIARCYDNKTDRHQVKTTCYLISGKLKLSMTQDSENGDKLSDTGSPSDMMN